MEFIISVFKYVVFTTLSIILPGCESGQMAPVEELHPQYAMNHSETSYTVRPGDTLYAIAFLYDQNAHDLAKLNHVAYPYHLNTGQVIHLSNVRKSNYSNRNVSRTFKSSSMRWYSTTRSKWMWPAQGQLASRNFNNPIELKGITILGQPKAKVVASANGVVAYAGNGLPGYGNLILIKHPNEYLTAYAFNSTLLVHEGQIVQAGQQIATMGQIDASRWGLHFEIRNHGSAVNPIQYLSKN